jgi:hypothetical protein
MGACGKCVVITCLLIALGAVALLVVGPPAGLGASSSLDLTNGHSLVAWCGDSFWRWCTAKFKSVAQATLCEAADVKGPIDDCGTDFATVDRATLAYYLPIIKGLQKTTFFRYFKVNLWRNCPFWAQDGLCSQKDCAVVDCDEDEVPKSWLDADLLNLGSKGKKSAIKGASGGSLEDDEEECDEDKVVDGSNPFSWAKSAGKVTD